MVPNYMDPILPGWLHAILAALAIAAVLFVTAYAIPSCRCSDVADATGRDTQYRIISGCYVLVNDRWVPSDSWRGEQELPR